MPGWLAGISPLDCPTLVLRGWTGEWQGTTDPGSVQPCLCRGMSGMFGIWVFTSQGAHGSLVLKCGSSMQCGSWRAGEDLVGLARAVFRGSSAAITPGLIIDNSRALKHPHPALHPRSLVPDSALGGGGACPKLSSCLTWEGRPRIWHLTRLPMSQTREWILVLTTALCGGAQCLPLQLVCRGSDLPRSTQSVLL